MATFITLVHFTEKGEGHITDSPKRAADFRAKAKKMGLKIKEQFWTIGHYDGVLIFEAPDDETAGAALLALGSLGNLKTETLRAFTAPEMEGILAKAFGK